MAMRAGMRIEVRRHTNGHVCRHLRWTVPQGAAKMGAQQPPLALQSGWPIASSPFPLPPPKAPPTTTIAAVCAAMKPAGSS